MAKVTINVRKAFSPVGEIEMHYGYICTVGPEGQLFADVPEELLQNELDNGRVTLVPEEGETAEVMDEFSGKDREILKAYLDGKNVAYPANIPGPKLLALCREVAAKE